MKVRTKVRLLEFHIKRKEAIVYDRLTNGSPWKEHSLFTQEKEDNFLERINREIIAMKKELRKEKLKKINEKQ